MADVTHKVVVDLDINTEPAKAKVAELEKMIQALTRGVSIGGGASGPGGAAPSPAPGESATGQMPAGTGGPMTIPTNPGGRGGGAPAPTATPGGTVPTPSSPGSAGPDAGGRGYSPRALPGAGTEPEPAPDANPGGGGGGWSFGGDDDDDAGLTPSQRGAKRKAYLKQVARAHVAQSAVHSVVGAWQGSAMADIAATGNSSVTMGWDYSAAKSDNRAGFISSAGNVGTTAATMAGQPWLAAGIAAASAIVAGLFGQEAAKDRASGAALSFAHGAAMKRGAFDEQNNMLGLSGSGVSASAAEYGYTPSEAQGIAGAFAAGAGRTRAYSSRALAIARTGASPGAAGAYFGLTAAGAGGTGVAKPEAMIGLAGAQDLRGSKIDEYLGIIASATSSLASSGMHLDLHSTEDFLRRLQATPAFRNGGLAQARAVATITGSVQDAHSQMSAPYAGSTSRTLMAWARRNSTTWEQALELLEGLTPAEAMEIVRASGLGERSAREYAGSMGVSRARALTMGGIRSANGDEYPMGKLMASAGPIKIAQARAEWKEIGSDALVGFGVDVIQKLGEVHAKMITKAIEELDESIKKMTEAMRN